MYVDIPSQNFEINPCPMVAFKLVFETDRNIFIHSTIESDPHRVHTYLIVPKRNSPKSSLQNAIFKSKRSFSYTIKTADCIKYVVFSQVSQRNVRAYQEKYHFSYEPNWPV